LAAFGLPLLLALTRACCFLWAVAARTARRGRGARLPPSLRALLVASYLPPAALLFMERLD
jgi:hypothetical protein